MTPDDAHYRNRVAQGFLNECKQDVALGRWRSSVDNPQLAVENAAKAVLALLGPVGSTHDPASPLRQAVEDGLFHDQHFKKIQRFSVCAESLGFDIHVKTDYGDELGGLTPWELFDEADARESLNIAEEAVTLAQQIVGYYLNSLNGQ